MTATFRPRPLRHGLPLLAAAAGAFLSLGASAQMLGLRLLDRPAIATAINARGDAVGSRSWWPCASHQCAPVSELVVWTAKGKRHVLPTPPGLHGEANAIGPDGTVAGALTDFATYGRAVVWRFNGSAYEMTELGQLGLAQSFATGIDATGRVVGYALTPFVATKPFVWTAATGLTDLTLAGFPGERVWDVSPNGRVVSDFHTWLLDDPASVRPLPPPPVGFMAPNGEGARVNDAGDLAINLLTTTSGSSRLSGMYRYLAAEARWQALAPPQPSIAGFGGRAIEADASILGRGCFGGVLAAGPDQLPAPLQDRLSPAYVHPSLAIHTALGRDAKGRILVSWLGAALAEPIAPCTGACVQVSSLAITGRFIPDPKRPGSCTAKARNEVATVVSVTDSLGLPQPGVTVQARYFDDYDLSQVVKGQTGPDGRTTLKHSGPACVGAISLLVESLKLPGKRFDRSTGSLFTTVIPAP